MTLKDNNITEQAWNRLYSRLEQDGLLEAKDAPKRTILRSNQFKWVASAAVLFICAVSVLMIYNRKTTQTNLLTLNNEKSAVTLVSTLEDGSIVYLSEYTSLQYPDHFQGDKRQVYLQGDAFFDIRKNRECPFIIDTKDMVIEVLGTAFNVKSKDNIPFSLSVKHGEVKVLSKHTGQTVYVKANETVLLQSESLNKSQTVDSNQFAAYIKRMHFKDQQLGDIVRIININSDIVQLKVMPGLENKLLTVTFSNDTPYTMAQLICMAMNLHFTQEQNTIVISERK